VVPPSLRCITTFFFQFTCAKWIAPSFTSFPSSLLFSSPLLLFSSSPLLLFSSSPLPRLATHFNGRLTFFSRLRTFHSIPTLPELYWLSCFWWVFFFSFFFFLFFLVGFFLSFIVFFGFFFLSFEKQRDISMSASLFCL